MSRAAMDPKCCGSLTYKAPSKWQLLEHILLVDSLPKLKSISKGQKHEKCKFVAATREDIIYIHHH